MSRRLPRMLPETTPIQRWSLWLGPERSVGGLLLEDVIVLARVGVWRVGT